MEEYRIALKIEAKKREDGDFDIRAGIETDLFPISARIIVAEMKRHPQFKKEILENIVQGFGPMMLLDGSTKENAN